MAGSLVGWAFQQTCPAASKLVLARLADAARAKDAYCWLSVPRMSHETGLAERTIRKHLDLLQKQGLIKIERRKQGRRQTSNGYHLAINTPASNTHAPDSGNNKSQIPGITASDARLPCTQCPPIRTLNEPPDNLPPIQGCATPAMMARVAAFRDAIGLHHFDAWFKEAAFGEGPPVTIQFVKKTAFRIAPTRYRETLERHFGEDFVVTLFIVPNAVSSKSETGAC